MVHAKVLDAQCQVLVVVSDGLGGVAETELGLNHRLDCESSYGCWALAHLHLHSHVFAGLRGGGQAGAEIGDGDYLAHFY